MGIRKTLAGRNRMGILVLYHRRSPPPRLKKGKKKKNAMWAHTGISKGFISELGTIPGCNCSAVQFPYQAAVRCLEGKDESYKIPGNRALDANCRLEQIP